MEDLIVSDNGQLFDYDNGLILFAEHIDRKTGKSTYFYKKATKQQIDSFVEKIANGFAEMLHEDIEKGRFAL